LAATAQVQYSGDNMTRPDNYHEWVWLSSGFGMAYGPGTQQENPDPPFDNVFVNPAAYRAFLKTGSWPDKTVMVLEVRSSQQKGSINQHGHFQGDGVRVEVHVKDEKRFPEKKWAFFLFGESAKSVAPAAATTSCFTCHEKSGAVDTTFVQFYPVLRGVAKQKGTLKTGD
jgi:hypothetical protein